MGLVCQYNEREGLNPLSTETELVDNDGRQDRIPPSPSTTTRYPVPAKAHFSTLMSHSKCFILLSGSDEYMHSKDSC
jgi:hypothetical protein